MSHVICDMSNVTCHMSHNTWNIIIVCFSDKVVDLFVVSRAKIIMFFLLDNTTKSHIQETPNLPTDAYRSTNIFLVEKNKIKKFNPERLLVFKALRVGPQMHQSNTFRAWTFHGCNLKQLLVLRLHKSVDEFTSPLVEHLPHMDDPCMKHCQVEVQEKYC